MAQVGGTKLTNFGPTGLSSWQAQGTVAGAPLKIDGGIGGPDGLNLSLSVQQATLAEKGGNVGLGIKNGQVQATIPQGVLQQTFAKQLKGLTLQILPGNKVHLGGHYKLFGIPLPVSITANVALTADGKIGITPSSFKVAGLSVLGLLGHVGIKPKDFIKGDWQGNTFVLDPPLSARTKVTNLSSQNGTLVATVDPGSLPDGITLSGSHIEVPDSLIAGKLAGGVAGGIVGVAGTVGSAIGSVLGGL